MTTVTETDARGFGLNPEPLVVPNLVSVRPAELRRLSAYCSGRQEPFFFTNLLDDPVADCPNPFVVGIDRFEFLERRLVRFPLLPIARYNEPQLANFYYTT